MLKDVLFALWFFLPAALANMIPILVARWPGLRTWNTPIDGGRTFQGRRIFGAHKTWRGLVTGMVIATAALALQQLAVVQWHWAQDITSQVDYRHLPTLVVGMLFGFGAIAGDAIESFFKRRRDIAPGYGWFPFDQIDYIIGASVTTAPFIVLTVTQYIWLIVLWLVVHIAASYIGYLLGLKERPI